jgi:hypothetical protein
VKVFLVLLQPNAPETVVFACWASLNRMALMGLGYG